MKQYTVHSPESLSLTSFPVPYRMHGFRRLVHKSYGPLFFLKLESLKYSYIANAWTDIFFEISHFVFQVIKWVIVVWNVSVSKR